MCMNTVSTKKLRREIEQSLLSAARAMYKSDEWYSGDIFTHTRMSNDMLMACAAKLAQGFEDRVIECCDQCAQLCDDDAKAQQNGDIHCRECVDKELDRRMGLDPMDLAKIKAGF